MTAHLANFSSIPPGHRFGLFFKGWSAGWRLDEKGKHEGLRETLKLDAKTQQMLRALVVRQVSQAQNLSHDHWQISAISEAPFMTGVGMEHPLENGFAFLNPYGLPYLPGSGVKGVLRRAAEELALENDQESGWDPLAVWWLFGFDTNSTYLSNVAGGPLDDESRQQQARYRQQIPRLTKHPGLAPFIEATLCGREAATYRDQPDLFLEHLLGNRAFRQAIDLRGAFCFWDVLPEPANGCLGVDILTPHQTNYYQGKTAPNDCGQPVPNQFLVLPAGSRFLFHVQCREESLPDYLTQRWRSLLAVAFAHAFDWLGFGAKTAVGYGQMIPDQTISEKLNDDLQKCERTHKHEEELKAQQAAEQRRQEELAAIPEEERNIVLLERGELNEHQPFDLFASLDSLESSLQQRAAKALKALWITEKRWSKKECSKKQLEKVKKIKSILGEP
jgi:CRISPR-associated protein Cmr6